MAFGFDDFSKFFDPISDVLGTSGRQGVGLLQQEPEDLRTAAMIAALIASGGSAAGLFGPGAAAGTAAAGVPATLVTPTATGILAAAPEAAAVVAPEVASLGAEEATRLAAEETARIAAQEAAQQGILQAKQLPPDLVASLEPNAAGIQQLAGPVDPSATQLISKGPGYTDYLNAQNRNVGINTFKEYEIDQARQAVAEGAKSTANMPSLDYGLNYTKPPAFVPEAGSNVSYDLTGKDTFRTAGDTDLSSALPKSQTAGISNPTANVGNRLPYTEGDYTQTESAFDKGVRKAGEYFDKASDYVDKNPYKSAALAYYGAYKTGMLDQEPVETPADDYKNPYSMTGFRRSSPNPTAYQYTPRYAEGGIAGYAKGGRSKAQSAMDFYDAMNPQQESAPPSHGSPGIYYDADPDTRYLDPMEAAMVRMSKLNSRANVQAPTMTPSRRMGELDFKPVAAAQGGIMGYAAGGDVPIEEDEFNKLTGRGGGGGRTKAEPDAKFSPTSEGAAAVSKLGQTLSAISPMVSVFAPLAGAAASAYGEHMAKNVNPDYSNEGRNRPAPVSVFIDSGSGISGASVSSSDFGGGAVDPAGRDSSGTPLAKGGGIMGYNLGGYAAGGNPRLLRGPGDGMSDHIPATINNRQPARLADGEYVITADVVSHLGNGSTEAGARQLDAMMKRIRKGRTGTPKQGKQINPRKYLPA